MIRQLRQHRTPLAENAWEHTAPPPHRGSGDKQGSASRARKQYHLTREASLLAQVSRGQVLGALQLDVRPGGHEGSLVPQKEARPRDFRKVMP